MNMGNLSMGVNKMNRFEPEYPHELFLKKNNCNNEKSFYDDIPMAERIEAEGYSNVPMFYRKKGNSKGNTNLKK